MFYYKYGVNLINTTYLYYMDLIKIGYTILLIILLPFFIPFEWIIENELSTYIMLVIGVILSVWQLLKDPEIKPPKE